MTVMDVIRDLWNDLDYEYQGEISFDDYKICIPFILLFTPMRYILDRTIFSFLARGILIPRATAEFIEKNKLNKSQSSAQSSKSRKLVPESLEDSAGGRKVRSRRRQSKDTAGAEVSDRYDHSITKEQKHAIDMRVEKFKESLWKALVYTLFTGYGFCTNYDKPWFAIFDVNAFWHLHDANDHNCPPRCAREPWPACSTAQFSTAIKLYFMIEFGFYIQAIFSLLFWEARRKDFGVMMMHHVVTLILISYSHYTRLLRAGTMVFLLHDVSDIPMETAKAFKYLGVDSMTVVFLVVFFVVWTLSRLVYFPATIIRAALFEAAPHCPHIDSLKHFYAFNTLLITLLVFHIYWTYLILKIVYKAMFKGKLVDVREDGHADVADSDSE